MELTLANFRAYVYIELNRGQKPSEIFLQLQQSRVGSVPSQASVFRWCQEFGDGSRESLEDRPRSGRPPSVYKQENVNIIAQLIAENPRQSLRQLSESVGCSKDSMRRIVEDNLGLRKLCSVWIPHCLSDSNKRDELNALVSCPRSSNNILWKGAFDCGPQRMRRGSCLTVFPQKKRTKHGFQNQVQDPVFIGRSSPIERLCCFLLSLVMASATLKRSIQENQ